MNRSPYWTRARNRIWRDTLSSAKGRVTPFVIGFIGIVLGFIINRFWIHKDTAGQLAILGTVSFGGSYAVWFLAAFFVNTLRVPWVLDAESGEQINELEHRLQTAEQDLKEIKEKRDRTLLFARLMAEGGTLTKNAISTGVSEDDIAQWANVVREALVDAGFPTDSVAFFHAAEKAAPMVGVIDQRNIREMQRRRLICYRDKLQEIMERRSL